MDFKYKLLATTNTWSLTIVRIMLGLVLLPHGAQKLLGWFGGQGPSGFMRVFEQVSSLPLFFAWFVIIIEFVGSVCLIVGFWVRFWSFSILCLFVGIILTVHLPNGFFMNWSGNQPGEGYEFHLLVIGMAWALVVGGAGMMSADKTMLDNRRTY